MLKFSISLPENCNFHPPILFSVPIAQYHLRLVFVARAAYPHHQYQCSSRVLKHHQQYPTLSGRWTPVELAAASALQGTPQLGGWL